MTFEYLKRHWGKLLIAAVAIIPLIALIVTYPTVLYFLFYFLWLGAIAITTYNIVNKEFTK